MWEGDELGGLQDAQGTCRAGEVTRPERNSLDTYEDVFIVCDSWDWESEVLEFCRACEGRHADDAHSWLCHGELFDDILVGGEALYDNAVYRLGALKLRRRVQGNTHRDFVMYNGLVRFLRPPSLVRRV